MVYNEVAILRGDVMEFITIEQASEKWGISHRRIQVLCAEGRIEGVVKFGRALAIPVASKKSNDGRIKSGKYQKKRRNDL
ncbi:hypothetical protein SDC9_121432 [bioreactor metagenome]|uniref:Helix-turn-helix domain-containing protein n=1 Tax=bioreactor metagenome TaxID=1076179 RepID=A0A645CBZ0_9ZZZZ